MNLLNELLNRVKVYREQTWETSERILAEKAKAILGDLFNHLETEIDEEFRGLLLKAESTEESINELRTFLLKRMSSGTVSGIIDSYGEATSKVLVEG
ncbi:hypothetical protein H0H81_012384 [Sphagnurus paluster]|uniref:Uncharacterized protein n=1 Tax=Sphagnurus paluster TaxID=117069 RepID=A0A9P7GGY7_9AGAR|nr:hypothetical protein H0H81_012384 [Sphagnurus paluster]